MEAFAAICLKLLIGMLLIGMVCGCNDQAFAHGYVVKAYKAPKVTTKTHDRYYRMGIYNLQVQDRGAVSTGVTINYKGDH